MQKNILWVLIATLMGFLNPLNLCAEDSSGPLETIPFHKSGKKSGYHQRMPPGFIPNIWAERINSVEIMIVLGPLATTALTIRIENEEKETIYRQEIPASHQETIQISLSNTLNPGLYTIHIESEAMNLYGTFHENY